ncbi:MAG: hypothetical protein H6709_19995 [Kofleriaceae bacterium]|nr:hypothetical protein [Kofleriaceae bacterium]MCB9574369.1 hypothetical protein [Kofleriaceae bacterium]
MATPADHAAHLESLRPAVLARLVEIRGSLDHALGRVPEAEAREHLDAVLRHMQAYIATWDWRLHRAFLQSYLALRAGDGMSSDDVIHVLAAVGDVVVEAVRAQARSSTDQEVVVAVTKVNAHTVRGVIDLVAEELERRRAQRDQLLRGGAP